MRTGPPDCTESWYNMTQDTLRSRYSNLFILIFMINVPCQDSNLGPPRSTSPQDDVLPIELSRLGLRKKDYNFEDRLERHFNNLFENIRMKEKKKGLKPISSTYFAASWQANFYLLQRLAAAAI